MQIKELFDDIINNIIGNVSKDRKNKWKYHYRVIKSEEDTMIQFPKGDE